MENIELEVDLMIIKLFHNESDGIAITPIDENPVTWDQLNIVGV